MPPVNISANVATLSYVFTQHQDYVNKRASDKGEINDIVTLNELNITCAELTAVKSVEMKIVYKYRKCRIYRPPRAM